MTVKIDFVSACCTMFCEFFNENVVSLTEKMFDTDRLLRLYFMIVKIYARFAPLQDGLGTDSSIPLHIFLGG